MRSALLKLLLALSSLTVAHAQMDPNQIRGHSHLCDTLGEFYEPHSNLCATIATTGGLPVVNPQLTGAMRGSMIVATSLGISGEITFDTGANAAATLNNLDAGRVSAVDYGAIGNDSTDNTAALNACVAASEASNGSLVCYIPNGIYRTSRVLITSTAKLECQSSQAVLKINTGTSGSNVAIEAASLWTLTFSFSGAIAANATSVTLASTTGLSVGQDVELDLGTSSTDPNLPQITMFNRITAIAGNVVSLAVPVPEAIASGTRSNALHPLTSIAQNLEISGCGFDVVSGLENSAAAAIDLEYARNVHIHDVVGIHVIEALVRVAQSENVEIDNAYVQWAQQTYMEAGRAIGGWESHNVTIRNVQCEICENQFMGWEGGTRGVHAEDISWATPSASHATTVMSNSGDTSGILLERATLNSGIPLVLTTPAQYKDITIQGTLKAYSLYNHTGSLIINGVTYLETRTVTFSLPLLASQSAYYFALPYGWYKSIQIYASTTTGLNTLYLLGGGGSGPSVQSALVAGQTVDMANTSYGFQFTTLGSDYGFNNAGTGHHGIYVTDGTLPADSYLVFTISYYPDAANTLASSGVLAPGQVRKPSK